MGSSFAVLAIAVASMSAPRQPTQDSVTLAITDVAVVDLREAP